MKDLHVSEKSFYPDYLSEILLIILATFGAVFALAMIWPPAIGREIDFVSAFTPKPEWYFLWLYQLVRYFPGKWAFAGTILVPVLAAAVFICMPFLDKGTARSARIAGLLLAAIGASVLILTVIPAFWP